MNKNKKLLQNVDVFYKLAMYGDRSSFLKSLAQPFLPDYKFPEAQQDVSALVDPLFKRAYAIVRESGGNPALLQQAWQNMGKDVSTRLAQLISAVQTASTSGDMVRLTNVQAVAELRSIAAKLKAISNMGKTEQPLDVGSGPTGKPAAKKPVLIDTEIQRKLSELNTALGFGLPLKVDGELGKETEAALDAFKTRIGRDPSKPQDPMSPNATQSEVFARINKEYKELHPQDFSWMEGAAKQKEEYEKSLLNPLNIK